MPAIYYDARLTAINDAGALVLDYMGRTVELPTFTPAGDYLLKQVGQVGGVMYANKGLWRFNAYLDQSLRRRPELDGPIGWVGTTRCEKGSLAEWLDGAARDRAWHGWRLH